MKGKNLKKKDIQYLSVLFLIPAGKPTIISNEKFN